MSSSSYPSKATTMISTALLLLVATSTTADPSSKSNDASPLVGRQSSIGGTQGVGCLALSSSSNESELFMFRSTTLGFGPEADFVNYLSFSDNVSSTANFHPHRHDLDFQPTLHPLFEHVWRAYLFRNRSGRTRLIISRGC